MNNRSIAGVSLVNEQRITEERSENRNEASLAEVFHIVTPRLVTFFRARGCTSTVAEGLAQKVTYELTGRVQEALRGARIHDGLEPAVIRIGDLKLDLARRLLLRGDEEIHLTPKEFDLLALLMKNSDAVLPHVKLLRSVWGLEYGGELEYLRNYVRTLRKKIEKVPANPEYIVSVPWVGYRFRKPKDSREVESQMAGDSIASEGSVHPPGWALVNGRDRARFSEVVSPKLGPTRAPFPRSYQQ
jgi:DNA-binding winged helix-turn-helix (wHTH) protein